MDFDMIIEECGQNLKVKLPYSFDLAQTLDCGQAFRWSEDTCGIWTGIVKDKIIRVSQSNNSLTFYNADQKFFDDVLKKYFDLERNYEVINRRLCTDAGLKKAIDYCGGIRILQQEPWETLCSFIISQNNNIPRIKGIIDRLCESFGEKITDGYYSFPSAIRLRSLSVDELAPLRAGFRSKYIIDAAEKVAAGEVDFEKIKISDLNTGRDELEKIIGVGPKVAECTLLYGFNMLNAFPIDVWVKKIMAEMYPSGLPACTEGVEGIAQQYLFHFRRNN